jgi:hypothetical protein
VIVYLVNPYSKNCNQLNKIPNEIAINKLLKAIAFSPLYTARCAATKATPEVKSTIVFTNGNINGSNVSSKLIPVGGQTLPIKIEGERLAWKKLQKNGKNNIASEIINH